MKKKKEEALQTIYVVEVKDGKRDPWRVLATFVTRGEAKKEAEDAARSAIMLEVYSEVRTSEWIRKGRAE